MQFSVVGRGLPVTPAMKEQAIKKLSRLDKYFDDPAKVRCTVTYAVAHRDQTAEINIHAQKTDLRAKVVTNDAYKAIDMAIDKLEKQIRRMKTQKVNEHKKNSLAEDMRLDIVEQDKDVDDITKIVKRKSLSLAPMDASEALARMEALDHSFFIYLDSKTQKVCVIYRREEGDFGIIEIDE